MNTPRPAQRPYFLRAYYEWLVDSGLTPQIIVNTTAPGVEAPGGYANDSRLVFNISMQATEGLELGNEAIEFRARFGAATHRIHVPIAAVLGLYARETGEGLAFGGEEPSPDTPPESGGDSSNRPRLTVVK
ncbi:MAG: stringent starvation protein B [Gammaproteobacteria bacterium]